MSYWDRSGIYLEPLFSLWTIIALGESQVEQVLLSNYRLDVHPPGLWTPESHPTPESNHLGTPRITLVCFYFLPSIQQNAVHSHGSQEQLKGNILTTLNGTAIQTTTKGKQVLILLLK